MKRTSRAGPHHRSLAPGSSLFLDGPYCLPCVTRAHLPLPLHHLHHHARLDKPGKVLPRSRALVLPGHYTFSFAVPAFAHGSSHTHAHRKRKTRDTYTPHSRSAREEAKRSRDRRSSGREKSAVQSSRARLCSLILIPSVRKCRERIERRRRPCVVSRIDAPLASHRIYVFTKSHTYTCRRRAAGEWISVDVCVCVP